MPAVATKPATVRSSAFRSRRSSAPMLASILLGAASGAAEPVRSSGCGALGLEASFLRGFMYAAPHGSPSVFPFRKHLFSSVDKPSPQRQPSAKSPECFMCGIVGLFLKNPKLRPELGGYLGTMLTTLSDRGPDSAGFAVYGEVRPDRVKLTLRGNGTTDFSAIADAVGLELGA